MRFMLSAKKTLCLFLLFYSFAVQGVTADSDQELVLVPAAPERGFEFPYYLRIPKVLSNLERRYLIVETNNSGVQDNFEAHIEITGKSALGMGVGPMVARDLELPLLIPVFPRNSDQILVYTHALDRDSMLIAEGKQRRLDLQLLRMVEDARKQLETREIKVEEKFVLVGFSASGTFSNRFAFLHPSSLLAVSSGAVNAFPMLPVESLDGKNLDFPLGLADIEKLTDTKFDRKNWAALAQMIYMGALDENDALQFSDGYSDAERELVFELVGENMSSRWSRAQAIYLNQQANTTLVTYGQVGHWTNGRIKNDMVNFIRSSISKDIRERKK